MPEARAAKKLERFGININFEVTDEEVRSRAAELEPSESESDTWSRRSSENPAERPAENPAGSRTGSPRGSPPRGLKRRLKAKCKAKVDKLKSKFNRHKPWS
ncbi:hypothetical protein VP1G_10550 [Cytospora mali]|uniref:Uncharacterized protein n=1 Tax=Cytospora mali TaxID=578113 RepID=A0A194UMY1_CYTMA|nr:hypothetical protein VP1G_10550 [Valsa mali var. pyri (nom. inval.)]